MAQLNLLLHNEDLNSEIILDSPSILIGERKLGVGGVLPSNLVGSELCCLCSLVGACGDEQ